VRHVDPHREHHQDRQGSEKQEAVGAIAPRRPGHTEGRQAQQNHAGAGPEKKLAEVDRPEAGKRAQRQPVRDPRAERLMYLEGIVQERENEDDRQSQIHRPISPQHGNQQANDDHHFQVAKDL
jgi:hypothetical protein